MKTLSGSKYLLNSFCLVFAITLCVSPRSVNSVFAAERSHVGKEEDDDFQLEELSNKIKNTPSAENDDNTWVPTQKDSPVMQVQVYPAANGVHIHLNRTAKQKLPKSIGFTVIDQNGNRRDVELKAVDRWHDPENLDGGFTGKMPTARDQSFVGFEIRIPFTKVPESSTNTPAPTATSVSTATTNSVTQSETTPQIIKSTDLQKKHIIKKPHSEN